MVKDLVDQYLLKGDLLGFLQACYTQRIGEMFYVLLLIIVLAPIYIRMQSLTYVSIIFMMFASIVWVALPVESYYLGWIFLILGITGLLFKAFR